MENTNTINKPVSMVLNEAKDVIVKAINSVQLHPTLLEMVIKDIYNEVKYNAVAFSEREKAEYEQALQKSEESAVEQ